MNFILLAYVARYSDISFAFILHFGGFLSWIIHCIIYIMPEFPSALGCTCQKNWYFLSISSLVRTWEWVAIHSGIIRALLYEKTCIKPYKCFDRGFDQNQFRLMTEQFISDQALVAGGGLWCGMQWCINLPGGVVFKFIPNHPKLVRKAPLKQQQESFSFNSSESCAGITLSSTIRMKLGRLGFF